VMLLPKTLQVTSQSAPSSPTSQPLRLAVARYKIVSPFPVFLKLQNMCKSRENHIF
jgi:hypothetical protein